MIILLFVGGIFFAGAGGTKANTGSEVTKEGMVINVSEGTRIDPDGNVIFYQILHIEITSGSSAGEVITIEEGEVVFASAQDYSAGDKVVLSQVTNVDGDVNYFITDYVRRDRLLELFIVFAVLAVAVGGIWGATSLAGMAFTFLIIFKFILPQIMTGRNAVFVTVVGAAIIIPVTFVLSHGFKTKTWIASVSTVITLILTGIVAALAVEATHLTGFGSEEAAFLQFQAGDVVNIKGLLLAGILISALGILDDITISQASIVSELKTANKKYKFENLFVGAMRVGRDHIASLINTLVLVYAGASLPLLLLFVNNPAPFADVINNEMIAEEVVRTLVGSMGLIMAVPITTALASYYYSKTSI